MKKIYSKPEMQVITIQQQGHLLAGSSKFYKYEFNKFENKDEKLEFKFDGFDDDEYDY